MGVNEYLLETLARQRLAEIHAAARRAALAKTLATPRRPLRVVVGETLIRLGTSVLGTVPRGADRLATKAS
jgi:hypothetical protein